jgi:transcriptional regulator with XRE-family HTH domain
MMSINENLKRLREANNFTVRELASAVNVSQTYIYNLERGTKALSLALAYDISKTLNCSLYELVEINE